MSNLLSTRARRGLAAGVATLVGASALTLVTATTASAAPTGSLTWGVSEQFFSHLSTRVAEGGVTVDTAAQTFTFAEGSTSVANGVTTIDYTGSIRGAFVNGGTEYYHVKIADPSVEIAADGSATISATVSSKAPAQGPATPAEDIAPVEVDVVKLPTTGDLATGFTAAAAPTGDFLPTLFDGLAAGVEAHFKQTGSASDAKKRPAGFKATVTGPKVVIATKKTATHAELTVQGTGFIGGDANYNGLYLGVSSTAGGLPDTSKFDTSKFAEAAYLVPSTITDGAFTWTLKVPLAKLTPGVGYSLYTWQAHNHSTHALDTATSLGVVVAKPAPIVKKKPAITLKWKKKSTAKKAGAATFKVKKTAAKAASGKVTFKVTHTKKVTKKVKKGKKVIRKTVTKTVVKTIKKSFKNGKAVTITVPKGTKKVVATYAGNTYYKKGSKTLKR